MANEHLMGLLFKGGDMGARLKSVQQVELALGAGSGEIDFTINSVDVDKSFLVLGGQHCAVTGPEHCTYTVKLKNATTVTVNVGVAVGGRDIWVTIVEFESGIKNIQRGITALLAADQHEAVSITTVDLTKTWVSNLGCRTTETSGRNQEGFAKLHTALSLYVQNPDHNAGDQWISWEIVEFA